MASRRTLSKSDFKLAQSCATKLYYREMHYPQVEDDNPYLRMLAEGGYMVEQLARQRFPGATTLEYGRDPETDAAVTRTALAADEVTVFEATMLAGRQLARIDVLQKHGNHFDLIEVKSKSIDGSRLVAQGVGPFRNQKRVHGEYAISAEWQPYIDDVAYQVKVLCEAFPGCTVTPWLLLVDKSRTTSIEALPQLFEIRRDVEIDGRRKDLDVRYLGPPGIAAADEILTLVNVESEVAQRSALVADTVTELLSLYTDEGVERAPPDLRYACCRACEFRVSSGIMPNGLADCWGARASVEPHIFDLYSFGTTKQGGEALADVMIRSGRVSVYDVDAADLVKADGSPTAASVRQLRQIECTRTGRPWLSPRLHEALAVWQYPLHFIDFETSALALPYHAGMHPFELVAFQWSCHSIEAPGSELRHAEWLNDRDSWPCLEFVEALRKTLGDAGTVLMWSRHERTTLRDIGKQMERYDVGSQDLRQWLLALTGAGDADTGRLRDMNELCVKYFVRPGTGRTSIKVVLDRLWATDETMRRHFVEWFGDDAFAVAADSGPYEALPTLTIADVALDVSEGTGAMRAYQAMLYGAERHDPALVAGYRDLLLRYCKLDTLAMVLIWDYWTRAPASG